MARGIETEFVKITPKRAAELLEHNSVNRRIRPRLVGAYASDMADNLWRPTGEAIKISRTGQLLDGQHRLSAIIEAGVPVELLVVSGLDDRVQELMDQGAARTAADALSLNGFQNAILTSGVARWLTLAGAPGDHMLAALGDRASTAHILKTAQENPDVSLAAAQYSQLQGRVPGSPTALCYSWLWLHRTDESANDEFWGGLADLNFYPAGGDARRAGLRALQRMDRDEHAGIRGRARYVATVSVLTRTWNYWRKREDVDTIPLRHSRGRLIPPVLPV